MCSNCKSTHALIPSFSLPGTSIGTKEAENYLTARLEGKSKTKSGYEFMMSGMQSGYLKSFEKMLNRCINNAKSIFTDIGDHYLNGIEWIKSVINNENEIITNFNNFCLENNVNVILCNRANILIFEKNKSGKKKSLNNTSIKNNIADIDSC
jgi:hypothetical protein